MGIGWGFGANMLARYLGEETNGTPLTAAVCINNPFNLEDTTKPFSGSRWIDFDQAMTKGLVQILNSNKMLFQGGKRGFDVNGALAAASVRDFERAISRVVHGYDSVDGFYENASCRGSLERVQIPVLCIQHYEDYTGPEVSVPRHLFETNPYAMLLVSLVDPKLYEASSLGDDYPGAASEWTHGVSLEWLTAVEISLLKGRHPLLSDPSFNIKQQQEWSNSVDNQLSGVSEKTVDQKPSSSVPVGASNTRNPKQSVPKGPVVEGRDSDATSNIPRRDNIEDQHNSGSAKDGAPAEEQLAEEELERGQVVQLAESVMKVLDVTMPGALPDAKKKQVLEAVEKGETLVAALEEAVPEEVRGKMSTAVSEVVQTKGLSLKLAGLGKNLPVPKMPESIPEKLAALTRKDEGPSSDKDVHTDPGNTSGTDKSQDVDNVSQSKQNTSDKETSGLDELDFSKKETTDLKENENSASPENGQSSFKDNKGVGIQPETHDSKEGGDQESGSKAIGEEKAVLKSKDEDKSVSQQNGQPVANENKGVKEVKSRDSEDAKLTDATAKIDEQSEDTKKTETKDLTDPVASESERLGSKGGKDDLIASVTKSEVERTTTSDQERLQTSEAGSGSTEPSAGPSPPPPGPHTSQSNAPSQDTGASSLPPSPETSPSNAPQTEVSAASPDPPPPSSETSPDPPPPSNAPSTESPATGPGSPPPTGEGPQSPPPPSPPSQIPSLGNALEALSGFDDSTQVAVTNVFGVVENVLDQLEKKDRPSTDAHGSDIISKESPHESNESVHIDSPSSHKVDSTSSNDVIEDNGSLKHEQPMSVEGGQLSAPTGPVTTSESEAPISYSHDGKRLMTKQPPVKVNGVSSRQGALHAAYDNSGVKLDCSKNDRGYIKVNSGEGLTDVFQGTRDSQQNNVKYTQPALQHSFLADNTMDLPDESGSTPKSYESGISSDTTSERRLKVMADEIDAEDVGTPGIVDAKQGTETDEKGTDLRTDHAGVITDLVMNALKLEVVRRLGDAGLEALDINLEQEAAKVARAVSRAVTTAKGNFMVDVSPGFKNSQDSETQMGGKLGILDGRSIVSALGSVLGNNSLLGQLVPFGVLAGVVLAALGAVYLIVSDDQDDKSAQHRRSTSQNESQRNEDEDLDDKNFEICEQFEGADNSTEQVNADKKQSTSRDLGKEQSEFEEEGNVSDADEFAEEEEKLAEGNAEGQPSNQGPLVGAMAAAMGATAAIASQSQASTAVNVSEASNDSGTGTHGKPNAAPEIAEKAISLVSPVVPKTADGEVDHERLVAMLTEVGQRGGPLTLIGKVALLWGGLRGAMSLADRLLAFLRMGERPLQQRLLGFGGMAVLLWSPVLVPLLPTLLQQWATKSPSGVADVAAGIGLYGAVFILVTIWGRRVRGYDRPLVAYGLNLFSKPKLRNFAEGMAIGLSLVSGYYGIMWALGYAQFTWDAVVVINPKFPGALASSLLTSWKVVTLVGQSLTMAVAVALVEEVVFRAWLQEEIAVDLGYHWAVFLSALAFAVAHWSPSAIVGLWFFSVALSGARARTGGGLSLPVGLHAGIVSAFTVMNVGHLVHYVPDAPTWFTGAYALHPLAGALGVGLLASLAVAFYPRSEEGLHKQE